jgi:hypothetical protein
MTSMGWRHVLAGIHACWYPRLLVSTLAGIHACWYPRAMRVFSGGAVAQPPANGPEPFGFVERHRAALEGQRMKKGEPIWLALLVTPTGLEPVLPA